MNKSDPVLAITVIVPLLIKKIILIRLLELNVNFVSVSLRITGLLIKKSSSRTHLFAKIHFMSTNDTSQILFE